MSELLIGCGSQRNKILGVDGDPGWRELTTLDNNRAHGPDVEWDLNEVPWPFSADHFDEVHAYEVLEHLGQQGDAASFFAHFSEIWRILKPGGILFATVPMWNSRWAWGDPSHTRIITLGSLMFLNQEEYALQVGKTHMSDFRHLYEADLETVWSEEKDEQFAFALKAVKPARRKT